MTRLPVFSSFRRPLGTSAAGGARASVGKRPIPRSDIASLPCLPYLDPRMSELDTALERLREHPGVEQLILLGRDGLLVHHTGKSSAEAEAIAARVPGLATAAESLGSASAAGGLVTAVLEHEQGVAIMVVLPDDLLLTALLRPGVGFAPLLREIRRERDRLVGLL